MALQGELLSALQIDSTLICHVTFASCMEQYISCTSASNLNTYLKVISPMLFNPPQLHCVHFATNCQGSIFLSLSFKKVFLISRTSLFVSLLEETKEKKGRGMGGSHIFAFLYDLMDSAVMSFISKFKGSKHWANFVKFVLVGFCFVCLLLFCFCFCFCFCFFLLLFFGGWCLPLVCCW